MSTNEEKKSNFQITKDVAEKVDSMSGNKGSDWKKTLSGALDEERLLCALVVLCIFYIGLTLGNAYHHNNEKDEDEITESCACKHEHRAFYISWSVICYVLWLGCHFLVYLHNSPPTCFKKQKDNNNEGKKQGKWCCYTPSSANGEYNVSTTDNHSSNDHDQSKIQKMLDNSKYHLWTQYYELYVIGITKNSEKFELNKMLENIKATLGDEGKVTVEANESESNMPKKIVTSAANLEGTTGKEIKKSENNTQEIVESKEGVPIKIEHRTTKDKDCLLNHMEVVIFQEETTTALPRHRQNDQSHLLLITQSMFHYLLSFIRFIAQLAVVPLLMIQILDTYAYLCFTANSYCNMRSQYQLHLDQTAMTFAFYCSLMISLLSTTMVRWFPLPGKNYAAKRKENEPSKNDKHCSTADPMQ